MAAVSFDHVTKRFADGTVAVDDLCLEVEEGEFLVVVGPTGCGKSTALRLLAGLDEATDGELRIADETVNHLDPQHRDVAMVFQSYALYPHMSVFDNIAFGLRMQGEPGDEVRWRVRAIARTLEITHLLRRKPSELSGGEQQRVALGRAIVREPRCVLLDEPLSSLDAALRVRMRLELRRLQRVLRATFLYVTHDQTEAMTMADRIAVMKSGRLQQLGSPREVYEHPLNVFVAGFIGSPSMNLIPVTIDRRTARASGFEVELPVAPAVSRAILGIRPEALGEASDSRDPYVDAVVDLVEDQGADRFVHASAGTDSLVARLDARSSVASGDRLRLAIDRERLHLFEDGGRSIL